MASDQTETSPPLTDQWTLNGVDITGAVDTSYTTPVTNSANNGAIFAVRVSNSVGSVTSNAVILTVN